MRIICLLFGCLEGSHHTSPSHYHCNRCGAFSGPASTYRYLLRGWLARAWLAVWRAIAGRRCEACGKRFRRGYYDEIGVLRWNGVCSMDCFYAEIDVEGLTSS